MKIKKLITDSVICMLIIMNVFVGLMIANSVKPHCVIDGCEKARCESSFYCKHHDHAPVIEMKVQYGKR